MQYCPLQRSRHSSGSSVTSGPRLKRCNSANIPKEASKDHWAKGSGRKTGDPTPAPSPAPGADHAVNPAALAAAIEGQGGKVSGEGPTTFKI
jgi:hypothetical protein